MPNEPNPAPDHLPTLSVTEAAHRLGVSERTVYRRLQAGKLHRAKVSDNRLTQVLTDTSTSSQIRQADSENVSNLSDIMSDTVVEVLREEIQEKDRLIALLMENQSEMIQTIQQMQQQLHELSSWVLAQKTDTKAETENGPAAYAKVDSLKKESHSGWLAKWLPHR